MFSILFICLPFISRSWDLEDVEYDFEIAKDPILNRELNKDHEFYMWNKFQQLFICSYPYQKKSSLRKKSESEDSNRTVDDIEKSLEHVKLCIHLETGGWWTYRVCFLDKIVQFHSHDGQKTVEFSLGTYKGSKKWTIGDLEEETNSTRYHEQYYTDGTVCELTNKPRQTTVKYLCDPNHSFKLNMIREIASCSYEIVVDTNILCKFPAFLPVFNSAQFKLTCNPTLSEEEMQIYNEKQKENSKKMPVPLKHNMHQNPYMPYESSSEIQEKTVLLKIGGKEYKVNLVNSGLEELFSESVVTGSTPTSNADSSKTNKNPSSTNANDPQKTQTSTNEPTKQSSNDHKTSQENEASQEKPKNPTSDENSDKEKTEENVKESENVDSFGSWILNSLREVSKSPFEEQMKNYRFTLYDNESDDGEDTRSSKEQRSGTSTDDSSDNSNSESKEKSPITDSGDTPPS